MMGTSGPATFALVSLLVDKKSKTDSSLVELQEKVREKLEKKFSGIDFTAEDLEMFLNNAERQYQ